MSSFFIKRPIFAWVLAIIICLIGILAICKQTIEQYPNLAPTTIRISASYPGASAQTVENTVIQSIEQSMVGLDNLMYMESSSNDSGGSVSLYFTSEMDPNLAMQEVQNQLQTVSRTLPAAVQQQGLHVSKSGNSIFMVLAFYSKDHNLSQADISDYVVSHLQDPISRINGVGQVQLFGAAHAMRIWLNPMELTKYKISTQDVITAIKAQNAQVSVGQIGAQPTPADQEISATITSQTLLSTPQQFQNITLRVNPDGSTVKLSDVAKVEIGSDNYNFKVFYNGQPSAGLAISLASGANEVQTSQLIAKKLHQLSAYFPQGLEAKVAYSSTPFVKKSIEDVVRTLVEAVILVFLVMWLFLQNLRATLIPTITIPVVLLGTMAILYACHYTINTLTMFAIVLAIGLLVDDAIVVIENVERIIQEEQLPPLAATQKAMGQIQGALVGIALVLSAVFVPMAFFGGSTGAIYRQFSITIVAAMLLSMFVALTLTPALCSSMLKPHRALSTPPRRNFFHWFNETFNKGSQFYEKGLTHVLKRKTPYFLLYLLLIGGMCGIFTQLPSSFLPNEDQGILMAMVQLPAGSTQQETLPIVKQAAHYFMTKEKQNVASVMSAVGFGMGGSGQNMAFMFIKLKDWSQRPKKSQSAESILERARVDLSQIKSAIVMAFAPPSIPGIGQSGGIQFELEDINDVGQAGLLKAKNELLALAEKSPVLSQLRYNGMENSPEMKIEVDQQKAQALGLSIATINSTLETAFGSTYVNDFIDNGRIKKVYVQAAAPYRMSGKDLALWTVKNNKGQMIPLSVFCKVSWSSATPSLSRFNGIPSLTLVGSPAKGYSTGEAMNTVEQLVKKIPGDFGVAWTGISYQEKISGQQAPLLYAISVLFIFLCLAALYESWSIPFSVLLVFPLGVLGAVLLTWLCGLDNDIYFQIAILTVVGLSAKNAILIVEFADTLYTAGQSLQEAILHAARIRLRPILMTSLALIFGVLPMALSTGAGAASQHSVGTGVIGGMISATILTIYFVPLFFLVIKGKFKRHNNALPPSSD